MYAFLIFFVVLVGLYALVQVTDPKEAFVGQVPLNTESNVVIPTKWIPTPVTLSPGTSDGVRPSLLPGPLPSGPYEQIAKNSPYPYQQPSLLRTTRARIGNLTRMKNDVDGVLEKVQTGALLPLEVPILGTDLDKALPVLSDPSQPLPQILRTLQLPAGLANMLPPSMQSPTLLQKYVQSFLDGASASVSFNVNYASPAAKAQQSQAQRSTVTETGFPSPLDLDSVADDSSLTGMDAPDAVTDMYAQDPRAEGRAPIPQRIDQRSDQASQRGTLVLGAAGQFDWKGRALQITQQIRKRGLNPNDFGAKNERELAAMPINELNPFSWKGYTKMICTRLQAVDMNKTDEMCGCPPSTWRGWND